jgi:MinD superfamily P-loop ATPase
MKEIVVISGKGGTGKTTVAASFAAIAGRSAVIADCDVDAADMHLLMQPDFAQSEHFYSGSLAVIDPERCNNCGMCEQVCRFDAVHPQQETFAIDPLSCEGCGYCGRVCPEKAIAMSNRLVGNWYVSDIKTGSPMVHARLGIGAENSGKLVAKVKNEAKNLAGRMLKDFIIVDGSPGIGCPVVSSLSGAHFAVLVTEPTVAAFHDLKRVYQLIKKFKIPAGCIINKSDLNPIISDDITAYLETENIIHLASLPYDESFTRAMVNGQTIVEYTRGEIAQKLISTWKYIEKTLLKESIAL